jgi:nucleotide-binding universal stress UspA family protein
MVDIRRILCPIDFSDVSRHALEHASAIAKWYEADLTALHVMAPPLLPLPPVLFAEPSHSPVLSEPDRRAAHDRLHEWLAPVRLAGIKTDLIVDRGNPASCILRTAASIHADLISMGTHGLSGFDRLVLGSVTEKVLRKATCPVLTVPPATATAARIPYARLLCPVDFSSSSLAALHLAFSMAKEADADLTMLHVVDWDTDDDLSRVAFDSPEFRRRVEEQTSARLESLVTEDVRTWCKPSTRIREGKPYRQILKAAEEGAADLIIIGVRGRNPVDLALFGSTTNQVVRHASCPVLTLRH